MMFVRLCVLAAQIYFLPLAYASLACASFIAGASPQLLSASEEALSLRSSVRATEEVWYNSTARGTAPH